MTAPEVKTLREWRGGRLQRKAAALLGISQQGYSRYERGIDPLPDEVRRRIEARYSITLAEYEPVTRKVWSRQPKVPRQACADDSVHRLLMGAMLLACCRAHDRREAGLSPLPPTRAMLDLAPAAERFGRVGWPWAQAAERRREQGEGRRSA